MLFFYFEQCSGHLGQIVGGLSRSSPVRVLMLVHEMCRLCLSVPCMRDVFGDKIDYSRSGITTFQSRNPVIADCSRDRHPQRLLIDTHRQQNVNLSNVQALTSDSGRALGAPALRLSSLGRPRRLSYSICLAYWSLSNQLERGMADWCVRQNVLRER